MKRRHLLGKHPLPVCAVIGSSSHGAEQELVDLDDLHAAGADVHFSRGAVIHGKEHSSIVRHFHILIELPLFHISYVILEAKGGGTDGTVVKVHLHLLSLKRKSKGLEFNLIVNNPAHFNWDAETSSYQTS